MSSRNVHAMLATAMLAALLVGVACGPAKPYANARPLTQASAQTDDLALPVQLGPTDGNEAVHFTVGLTFDDAAVDRFLAGLTDPRLPSYHRYLTPAEYGDQFGVSMAAVESVVRWAESGGLTATTVPQRTSVALSGTAAAVNQLLGVTLVDWRTSDGIRFHRPGTEPVVPGELDGAVSAIVGLDTEPVMRPAIGRILASGVPGNGLVRDTVSRAYEIDPLHAVGLNGEGQAVAIVSFDTFTPSDIDVFDERNGFDSPPVELVRLAGASTTPGPGTSEVALDIQVIRGIAPQARIIDYEGPQSSAGVGPMIARIVADGRAQIISISWGLCETYRQPQTLEVVENELSAAFAAGITTFVASGDDGAFDCRRVDLSEDPFERDVSRAVDFPASSPSVVAVGGTFLSTREDGTYLDEAGWEEPLGGGGGGGGLSTFYTQPSWQVGAGVDNSASNGMRQVPDVAGPADPASGFFVIFTEPTQGLVSGQVGGTSAAAPFWAAAMTLTQQLAEREGVTALGTLGPTLYEIAGEQATGAVFHDVIRGGNLLFEAGPGWDYSTGLGTPRVAPLARAIIDFVKR